VIFTEFVEVVTYLALVLIIATAGACFYAALNLFKGDDDEHL